MHGAMIAVANIDECMALVGEMSREWEEPDWIPHSDLRALAERGVHGLLWQHSRGCD